LSVIDMHVHTVVGSSDSNLTPEELVREAVRIGLDGVCLTEHRGKWDKFAFEKFAREQPLLLINAMEVETDMGHIIVLGTNGYVSGMSDARTLRRVVEETGGVMITAHPFRNYFNRPPYNQNLVFRDVHPFPETALEAAKHPLFELVHEVEVGNGGCNNQENFFALDVARQRGHSGTGGSDAHSTHGLGKCVTVFDGDIRSEKDLIEAIRAKAFKAVEGFHLGQFNTYDIEAQDEFPVLKTYQRMDPV